jgi:hypothetical protein
MNWSVILWMDKLHIVKLPSYNRINIYIKIKDCVDVLSDNNIVVHLEGKTVAVKNTYQGHEP